MSDALICCYGCGARLRVGERGHCALCIREAEEAGVPIRYEQGPARERQEWRGEMRELMGMALVFQHERSEATAGAGPTGSRSGGEIPPSVPPAPPNVSGLPVGAVNNVGTSPDRTGPAAASDAGAPDDEEVCCRHCGDSPVIGGDSHDADLCGDCAENVTVCRRCGEIRACDIDTMLCAECDVDPDDLRED